MTKPSRGILALGIIFALICVIAVITQVVSERNDVRHDRCLTHATLVNEGVESAMPRECQ